MYAFGVIASLAKNTSVVHTRIHPMKSAFSFPVTAFILYSAFDTFLVKANEFTHVINF